MKHEEQLVKFKDEKTQNKKKMYATMAVSLFLLVGAIVVFVTYSIFDTTVESSVVDSGIDTYSYNDLKVIMTFENTITDLTFDDIDAGTYTIANILCNNGATASYASGTLTVSNLTKSNTICNVKLAE